MKLGMLAAVAALSVTLVAGLFDSGSRTASAAGKNEDTAPKMAKLVFTLTTEGAGENAKTQTATATLEVPAPRGVAQPVRDYSSYSRSYTGTEAEPLGEGTASWSDKGAPSTRVTAVVRVRDDNRLWISWAVDMLDDAGTLAGAGTTPPVRLMTGPSLSGQVILAADGGKATLGELKDRKGRKVTVSIDGSVSDVK